MPDRLPKRGDPASVISHQPSGIRHLASGIWHLESGIPSRSGAWAGGMAVLGNQSLSRGRLGRGAGDPVPAFAGAAAGATGGRGAGRRGARPAGSLGAVDRPPAGTDRGRAAHPAAGRTGGRLVGARGGGALAALDPGRRPGRRGGGPPARRRRAAHSVAGSRCRRPPRPGRSDPGRPAPRHRAALPGARLGAAPGRARDGAAAALVELRAALRARLSPRARGDLPGQSGHARAGRRGRSTTCWPAIRPRGAFSPSAGGWAGCPASRPPRAWCS